MRGGGGGGGKGGCLRLAEREALLTSHQMPIGSSLAPWSFASGVEEWCPFTSSIFSTRDQDDLGT